MGNGAKLLISVMLFFSCACDAFCERAGAEVTLQSEGAKRTAPIQLNFGLENVFVSKYIPKSGTQIGRGSASQSLAYCSTSGVTVYGWVNHGFPDNEVTETDFGLSYGRMLSADVFGGEIDWNVGYQRWIFGLADFSSNVIEGRIAYAGAIRLNMYVTRLVGDHDFRPGLRLFMDGTWPLEVVWRGVHSVVEIGVAYAHHREFYGMNGYAHSTPGVRVATDLGSLSVSGFCKLQMSSDIPYEKRNFLYAGVGVHIGL